MKRVSIAVIGLGAILVILQLFAAYTSCAPAETPVTTFALKLDGGKPACEVMCHNEPVPFIDPNPEGMYTLAYEANHAWEGHGFDALGTPKTLDDCLACHAVGTDDRVGQGNIAPKSLRDIVHPPHVGSPHFAVMLEGDEEERPGNCFTCHTVEGSSSLGLND